MPCHKGNNYQEEVVKAKSLGLITFPLIEVGQQFFIKHFFMAMKIVCIYLETCQGIGNTETYPFVVCCIVSGRGNEVTYPSYDI